MPGETMDEEREQTMMGMYGGGMGGGLWILIGLFWILLIAAIIWLVVRLLPSGTRASDGQRSTPAAPGTSPAAQRETPVEILDHRFARGEIDLETYQTHRAALIAARGGE